MKKRAERLVFYAGMSNFITRSCVEPVADNGEAMPLQAKFFR
jgi:hypothetical protein